MMCIHLLNQRVNLSPWLRLLSGQLSHRRRRNRERRVNAIYRINRHEIDAPILVQHPVARSALVGVQPFDEARGADVGVRREGVERGEAAGEETVLAVGAGNVVEGEVTVVVFGVDADVAGDERRGGREGGDGDGGGGEEEECEELGEHFVCCWSGTDLSVRRLSELVKSEMMFNVPKLAFFIRCICKLSVSLLCTMLKPFVSVFIAWTSLMRLSINLSNAR